jgi:hypothetical protein
MLKILGENYYIDIDKLDEYVNIPNMSGGVDNHISVVKFETIKAMIDVILTENEPVDETLGNKSTEITIPFKIAFNTLLNKKIINKY